MTSILEGSLYSCKSYHKMFFSTTANDEVPLFSSPGGLLGEEVVGVAQTKQGQTSDKDVATTLISAF